MDGGRAGIGYAPGIWTLPITALDSGIAAQRQVQVPTIITDKAQALAADQRHRQELELRKQDSLAKYDQNQNGVIEPAERSVALSDPIFLQTELDAMHTN